MTSRDTTTGLRARLVAAGVELLAREGVHALTLREIARQAGVSHGAPRRHFASHAELLAAIAGHGFGELAEALGLRDGGARDNGTREGGARERGAREALAVHGPAEARDRLERLARGYLAFAADRPGMFELMFRHDVLEGSGTELRSTSLPLFEALTRLVAAVHPPTDGDAPSPTAVAAALWANLHGLAQLRAWGSLGLATGSDDLEPVLRATLDANLGPAPR
ncbi:TetR/AcrR family transcriptional regulator [Kitasatospora sp. NPDC001527]|uniref:TetR/AcrR family transcriptional regulator n=1 Tax=Kitasatospora sp. NPDC001527 TaxID=3154519 RepID=UPI003317FD0D